MKSDTILSVENLFAGYGDRSAVADVSFSLRRGEILCLVGESGCGKSTLLKAIMGTTPGGLRVLSGTIEMEGEELTAMPARQRQKLCCDRLGMVFQNPGSSYNPIRSYRKQIIETLKSHGKYRAADFRACTEEAFGKLGLTDVERILACCPYEMSGGMNQRIALAVAILLGQEILLADEPTSALDATIQLQVAQELRRLRDVCGITQIVVTHNLALAKFLADRIGVMYAGRLVEFGSAQTVLSQPRHPYTRSLLAAIPALDGHMPTGLPGQPPVTGPQESGCEFCARCPQATAACAEKHYQLSELGEGHFAACFGGEGGAL